MTRHHHRSAASSLVAVAGGDALVRACGHSVHVGTCPECQRAQLDRWALQLSEADRSRGRARSAA